MQLADLIEATLGLRITDLRVFLRGNDTLFGQVRRGGFELGRWYRLPGAR